MWKKRRDRLVFTVSLIAGAAFIALAVWGLGFEPGEVGKIFLILLGGLLVIVVLAITFIALMAMFRKLFRQKSD